MEKSSGSFAGFTTKIIHAGEKPSERSCRSIIPPLSLSATFQRIPDEDMKFPYGRLANPSRDHLESELKIIEESEYAVTYGSGMAAITAIMNLLEPGQHLIGMNDCYSGTYIYVKSIAENMKISCTFVDARDPDNIRNAIRENTKMVWIETPSNPSFHIVDLAKVSLICREHQIVSVIDNSILTPYFLKPLKFGFDIVMHSVGKYLNGHSDVIMGAVTTNHRHLHERFRHFQMILGGIPSPFDCYLASRGLKTLELRMERHMNSGLQVAKFLEAHPSVERVIHPGLPSHPQHELAKNQSTGFSGILGFFLKAENEESLMLFFKELRVVRYAGSFGGFDSVIQSPALWSHEEVDEKDRLAVGMTFNYLRLHVGLENVEDIMADLDQALRKVSN